MTHYDPRLNDFLVIEQKFQSLRLIGTLIFVKFRFLKTVGDLAHKTVPTKQKVRQAYEQAIADNETPIESPIESPFLGWENMSREELLERLKGLEANASHRPPPVSRSTPSDSASLTSINQLAIDPLSSHPQGDMFCPWGALRTKTQFHQVELWPGGGGPAVPM